MHPTRWVDLLEYARLCFVAFGVRICMQAFRHLSSRGASRSCKAHAVVSREVERLRKARTSMGAHRATPRNKSCAHWTSYGPQSSGQRSPIFFQHTLPLCLRGHCMLMLCRSVTPQHMASRGGQPRPRGADASGLSHDPCTQERVCVMRRGGVVAMH